MNVGLGSQLCPEAHFAFRWAAAARVGAMPNPRVTRHLYNGQEITPGLRIHEPSSAEIRFNFVIICDEVNPDRWHAEVAFADVVILQTEPTDTFNKAHREAETALRARLVRLFSDSDQAAD